MLRVCTSSIIVTLSIGGVSLILTDVRFGSFIQNLVTNVARIVSIVITSLQHQL